MSTSEFNCDAKNVISKKIYICCDSRREKCEYAFHVVKDNFHMTICLKKEEETSLISK